MTAIVKNVLKEYVIRPVLNAVVKEDVVYHAMVECLAEHEDLTENIQDQVTRAVTAYLS